MNCKCVWKTGVAFPSDTNDFSNHSSETKPPIQVVAAAFSVVVKWPRREADHLPPLVTR
jgi:hypothetical protein